ncbi:hypothetical protein [Nitrosomonas sp.]|uniref:hypothetical protein n=1 Tax=Nitrosomonas sp. TaxID=42353 RepID=UPI0025E1EC83|nr:hypothetical protein [Nitrosomonas sp.]
MKIFTDKLKSYGVAHRKLVPDTIHDTSQYVNHPQSFHTSQRHAKLKNQASADFAKTCMQKLEKNVALPQYLPATKSDLAQF